MKPDTIKLLERAEECLEDANHALHIAEEFLAAVQQLLGK